MHLLAAVTVALTALDNWTTYACLRRPIAGFEVTEANPIASWLFQTLGLAPGLCLDIAVTTVAVAFLARSPRLPRRARVACLAGIALLTAAGAANNLRAMVALGLL